MTILTPPDKYLNIEIVGRNVSVGKMAVSPENFKGAGMTACTIILIFSEQNGRTGTFNTRGNDSDHV